MQLIKKRFKKAIREYDKNAIIQRNMAENLVQNLLNYCNQSFDKILEIGCGTGMLTENIAKTLEFKEFVGNDIFEESEEIIKKIIHDSFFICEDIEKANIEKEFDLIISNATFQWIKNLKKFEIKLNNISSKKGIVAFTTFGVKNFSEIKEITEIGLKYKTASEIKEIFNEHFKLIYEQEEIIQLDFDSPVDVLKHIKNTGTNAVYSKKWTKSDLNMFCQKYSQLYTNQDKIKLTYNPMYFIFQKKF